MGIRIAKERLGRAKCQVRRLTRRNRGRSITEIRDELNPFIRGWVNYFALADAKAHMQRLDEWARRRLRQVLWKQWKTPANRYRNLRERGVSEYWAIRAGGTSKGCWRLSASPPLHQALDVTYWQDLGLESFLQRYKLRHT
ncbi:MAG TPA: group II intron maturase-specific domain-containing protein [Anaerolineae bacterium]|nr:group II intron maturase-specific domain-containing protein [Anaerolineae bacterium]